MQVSPEVRNCGSFLQHTPHSTTRLSPPCCVVLLFQPPLPPSDFLSADTIRRAVSVLLTPTMQLVHATPPMIVRVAIATMKHLTCISPAQTCAPIVEYALASLNPDAVDRSHQVCARPCVRQRCNKRLSSNGCSFVSHFSCC